MCRDVRGLHLTAQLPDDIKVRLDSLCERMPELELWFSFTRDWETVLYELTHMARGLFGIPMAEALHLRSSGRSGKDTVANLLECVCGSYAESICCDALCAVPCGDSPSPTLASLRARRFVSIREPTTTGEKQHKLRADVYKRMCDPHSKVNARRLYGDNMSFVPQYLAMFCTNHPISIEGADEAVRARTAIVDHTAVFVDTPTEANHSQRRDMSKGVLAARYRVGCFWLLQRVYHHFLRDRRERNVRRVPERSLEAVLLDCTEERDSHAWDAFLRRLEPTRAPRSATPAKEVEEALCVACGVEARAAVLFLQGKGFNKERRKRGLENVWMYQYSFLDAEGRKGAPMWVQLVD